MRTHAEDRVSVDGHSWKRAAAVSREVLGGVSTTINPIGLWALYSSGIKSLKIPGFKALETRWLNQGTSLSIPVNRAEPLLMEKARDLGIPVFLHHIRGEEDVMRARDLGAQGVMADRLDLLGSTAASGSLWLSSSQEDRKVYYEYE